jgi:hypothetical protein
MDGKPLMAQRFNRPKWWCLWITCCLQQWSGCISFLWHHNWKVVGSA